MPVNLGKFGKFKTKENSWKWNGWINLHIHEFKIWKVDVAETFGYEKFSLKSFYYEE